MLQLAHRQRGEGPPLVLLHGLFGASSTLNGIARALSTHFRVISFDLPGHGKTPQCDDMRFQHLANCLYYSMQQLGVNDAVLVGHSLGGKVAMQLALSKPEAVNKLCVLDIAPVRYEGGLENVFAAALATDLTSAQSRDDVDAQLAKGIPDAGVRAFLLTNLARDANKQLQWRINFSALFKHYQDFLQAPVSDGHYDGEVLFIKGEQSDYLLPAHKAAVLKFFPRAELKQVAGTGHWLHAEKPDVVHALLRRFLGADN